MLTVEVRDIRYLYDDSYGLLFTVGPLTVPLVRLHGTQKLPKPLL